MLYTKSCALFHSKKCVTFYFCSSLFKIKRSKLTSARNATRTRLIDMYLSVLIFYYYICLSTRSFLGFISVFTQVKPWKAILATTNGKEPLVQRQFRLLGREEFSAPQKGKCAPTLYIECVFVSHSLTILFAEAFICFYICYEFEHYTLTIILIPASLNTIHTNNTGYRTPAEIVTQKSSFIWYGKIIFFLKAENECLFHREK